MYITKYRVINIHTAILCPMSGKKMVYDTWIDVEKELRK